MRKGGAPLLLAALLATAAVSASAEPQTQDVPQQAPPVPAAPPQAGPPPNATDSGPPPEEAPAPPPVQPDKPTKAEPATPPPPPKPPEPMKRTRHDAAILQATDKITAETLRFQARVGSPVRYKDLVITVRACETTAPDEAVQDSVASLDVISQPLAVAGRTPTPPRQVYRGWMFANSPSLHPFGHPVYDLWLIACRTAAPGAPAGKR